jgi:predicted amidophosphoribosyltransferase
MKIAHYCGYYSDFAVKVTGVARPRNPPFWEAYMFCWAVKSGQYHREFYVERPEGRLNITKANFHLVRPTFRGWAAQKLPAFSTDPLVLVPVPNAEALAGVTCYRTLEMAKAAFEDTAYSECILDALHWNAKRQKAHEGGSRKRSDLLPLLSVKTDVKDKKIVLVDDLVTTGGNLLACYDRLAADGAAVLGAITCGRSVYDLNAPPFGQREFELTEELADYRQ